MRLAQQQLALVDLSDKTFKTILSKMEQAGDAALAVVEGN
jgi:hypothetical protein